MERLPPTIVIHKNLGGKDTIFATMTGPFLNSSLGKYLGVIRRGIYQEESEDNRWTYEPVLYLWPYVDPDSDSSDNGSSNERRKY